jgi:hypothetical protein
MNPDEQLAVAIYRATISAGQMLVPMSQIDSGLKADGIDSRAAAAVLIEREFIDDSFGGAYWPLSPAGIAYAESLLNG